jgi:hypothetical protein
VDRLDNDLLAIRALGISKYTIAALVRTPRRRDRDGAGKFGTENERARWLRLVLSLRL